MGILRVDKISGLETPTPVTGSVVFDGTGDYLDLTLPGFDNSNFTFELWFWADTFNTWNTIFEYGNHTSSSDGIIVSLKGSGVFARNGSTDISNATINTPYQIPQGSWNHLALTREGTTARLHINGNFIGSATWSKVFTETNLRIASARYLSGESYTGYISNFRVLKGTALYNESNFTPPIHALEVIKDTTILCCNNSDSAGADGTGKTITVNGDAAASTFSPEIIRDFTGGTEFKGVTTFDTQGYFVPPSGTTEQRGAGRAIFAGGYVGPARNAFIESVNINTLGNTTKFGTLVDNHAPTSTSSATRQIVGGGYAGSAVQDNLWYITTASGGNSVNFGRLGTARRDSAALSNNIRSIWGGGTTTGSTNPTVNMEYVTSASLGDGTSFGTLTASGRANAACASPTRGIFFGGYQAFASPVSTYTNVINYITIATTGNGTDFGDLAVDNNGQKGGHAAFSSSTRGVVGGGAIYGPDAPAYTLYDTIEYVTIASTGNAQDFGDLTGNNNYGSGTSNSTRGIFNQGTSPTYLNTIQYVTIASTGNAQDFGDAINASFTYNNSSSDSHGGLS